jgi:hypothetical protein
MLSTLTSQYLLLAERIKHHIRTFGPREPEEILKLLQHRHPPIIPFTVWTMLFSGAMRLNGFGEMITPEQFDGREYVQEEIVPVSISRPVRILPR